MTSRDDILRMIRRQLPIEAALPDLEEDWIRYENPIQQFTQVLQGVGGQIHVVSSLAQIPGHLSPLLLPGKRIVSGVPGVLESVFDFSAVTDPHEMADVELAILPGEIAVAENAAVWVQTNAPAQRAACFLSQHLALVLPAARVVNNLHEAYDSLHVGETSFGCFISGPSKTADIEQSLVKGAHGARTLNVFLVES